MANYDSFNKRYASIYSSRTEDELNQLSQIKRYLEVYSGDEDFRDAVSTGAMSLSRSAEVAGVQIDVTTLTPCFQRHLALREPDLDPAQWPLAARWRSYIKQLMEMRNEMIALGSSNGVTPAFDQWRSRQIRRTSADLGISSQGIVHPPIAFELSSGCSVGCWFCGISAEKFRGHFALDADGKVFWRELLRASGDVLGEGLKNGFLYWATDPLDNPDYLDFLDIFYEEVGTYPQTTTAIPLRHLDKTKGVIARWSRGQHAPNRFSILNTKILRQVHETFSPRELLNVELVLQNFGSLDNAKSNSGRTLQATLAGGTLNTRRSKVGDGTIACVTGFLVNIVERTVRLVSPCMPSERWPDGFIVFSQASFTDVEDYKNKIRQMVQDNMQIEIRKSDRLRFSENFRYHFDGKSFVLETSSTKIESSAVDLFAPHLDPEGTLPTTILQRAISEGKNMFAVVDAIGKSRDAGLIEVVNLGAADTAPAGTTESEVA